MFFYKKIIVTGGNGFIGGALIRGLLDEYRHWHFYHPSRLEVDLQNREETLAYFNSLKPDIVIHSASLLPNNCTHKESKLANNTIDRNVIEACSNNSKCKIIYFSGTSIYAPTTAIIDEKSPIKADNDYFQSKVDGENLILENGLKHVILRISAPYGNTQKSQTVLQKFVRSAINNDPIYIFGKGDRVQNFTYIKDIISVLEILLKHKNHEGIYNICSESAVSMQFLAETIISVTSSSSNIISLENKNVNDRTTLNISNKKAKDELGWFPKFDLKSGIKDMLAI